MLQTNRLGTLYDKRNNSFDDLRFIFAVMVLYVHSYALLYGESVMGTDPLTVFTHFQISPGTLAVYGFFVLSGFFMIQSLESNPSLIVYAKNRIYRIIPAFWLSLFLASFILVPLISKEADIFSLHAGSSLYFFFHSAIFHINGAAWTIQGAFPNNPLIDNINGSMWTLKYEVLLYVILPILYFIVHHNRKLVLYGTFLLGILAVAYILKNFMLFSVFNPDEYSKLVLLSSFFFYGVMLYLYRESIIVSKRLMSIGSLALIFAGLFGNLPLLILFIFPYILVSFGSIVKTSLFSKTGDYSYGMYIYAFPVQQTLVHFFKSDLNASSLFFMSFLITLLMSIVSWHLLEKKVLLLKKRKQPTHL
ncbi:MAG TPA: acyltransferase [Sulfuricurvum sp.]|nr:MAG: hypothetical protein B7Y30_04580 [Campylobacterales bacterium 16-40-21]OZA02647.1 MAG: hypothetical protein B7X89_08435 [Sulfuricurvum sp. 17-40-25]HQS67423.1 acyltransferase [Sulfuricurvum sp.]